MTKMEAQAFKARWEAINAAEREELRTTSLAHKLRQLAVLMASAGKFGWTEALAADDAEVRDRWNRLRRLQRV
ncbi:MAG: hypothetical protein HY347_11365 [candidate division NC10 bacterium]|nr:hypothetical protein [candidate division NC10 bacterium]